MKLSDLILLVKNYIADFDNVSVGLPSRDWSDEEISIFASPSKKNISNDIREMEVNIYIYTKVYTDGYDKAELLNDINIIKSSPIDLGNSRFHRVASVIDMQTNETIIENSFGWYYVFPVQLTCVYENL